MVSLLVMASGFDVGRAVGAGLGDRRRVLEFIDEFAAAWTRPLSREDGYGEDVLQSVEEHLGVRLPPALREAYLVLGKRTDLTARQDPLLPGGCAYAAMDAGRHGQNVIERGRVAHEGDLVHSPDSALAPGPIAKRELVSFVQFPVRFGAGLRGGRRSGQAALAAGPKLP